MKTFSRSCGKSARLSSGAALLLCAGSAFAQLQFAELRKQHLPVDPNLSRASDCEFVDVECDGDLDILFAGFALYLNDGQRVFTDVTATHLPTNQLAQGMALGDVDGDGYPDLVLATGFQDRLYLNGGRGNPGHFTDVTGTHLPVASANTGAVTLGDVDGDGDLDLITANLGQQNQLYRNDGPANPGHFSIVPSAIQPPQTQNTGSVTLGDVDNDGDLDLVFGNSSGSGTGNPNRLYLNDGGGRFNDVTGTLLPLASFSYTADVLLDDVDRDGDLDLFIASGTSALYLNDGPANLGHFTDVTTTHVPGATPYTNAAALGDVDGDGDPDLILGTSSSNQDQLYLNDGAGVFSVGAAPSPHQDSTRRVALGDVDNDGDLDLMALTSSLGACLYANDGAGLFLDLSRPRIPTDILQADAVALADVDNDGDIDAVFGTDGGQNRLLLNNGAGTFIDVTATHVPVDNDHTREIWFGDVDGDGDLDLVIGNSGAQNRLYRNDGPASPGHFTDVTTSHLPPEVDSTLGLALGDVDNDGDLDLLTGNTMGQQNRLYLNDGSGHFSDVTAIQLPPDSDATTVVVLVDVDNDGDLDLLTGNGGGGGGQQNQLYINAGTGIFAGVTASQMPPALDPTTSMAPGDVDGDGDVDLVIGNCGAQNRLYLNDGPANRG
jgi:hypothetical protein